MTREQLGNSNLEVGPLALGGNVFGWTADEARSFAVLDAFVAAGFNLIDTADVYSGWIEGHVGGESERMIGNWIRQRGRHDDVLIATKVGMEMAPGEKGLSRDYIFKSVDRSLRNLGVDYIDLYQAHIDDPDTPLEETLGAFADLVAAGKVCAIGASNYSPARLAEALEYSRSEEIPGFVSLQPWYNLYDRLGFEGETAALCAAEGLGVIPYFGLGCGFLTGKYRGEADLAGSARAYRVKQMLNPRGYRILAALDEVAAAYAATPAQIALAWLRGRGITAPIASATSAVQIEELVAFADIALDAEAMALLDGASEGGEPPPGW